ncbi:MAG: polyprenyl synthetase family protein [Firmicutes bacterium]|nr:polyprenyl synthetase family protein [Bacillota bacterium]
MSLDFLKEYELIINENIKKNIDKIRVLDKSHSSIIDGMEYTLLAGGKRIRPSLCLLGAEIGGLNKENILNFAAGIEFIHTYSLVHDDLPGMDDDNLRRGKPTCHIKYGEGEAILIGDALLTHGVRLLMEEISTVKIASQFEAIKLMLDSIGLLGMIGGQAADLQQEKAGNKSLGILEYIHKHKTGSLLEGSLLAGAILANSDNQIKKDLISYSESFGLAYQITDDILDEESSVEELGKPIGSDVKNEKLTYLKIFGINKAKEMAVIEVDKCKKSIGNYGIYGNHLIDLADYLLERRK